MKRKLSALEARRRLGEVLEGVYYRGDEVAVERAGKVMAVVIPLERYEALERGRQRLLDLIERTQERNRDVAYEIITREVATTVREVREGGSSADVTLTAEERDVLRLVAQGYSNDEIASTLIVSPSTVRTHVRALSAKLETSGRTKLIAKARALRLVPEAGEQRRGA